MNDKLLFCCVNVFGASPTFLLPVFMDTKSRKFYAQVAKNNTIEEFESIEIDDFMLYSRIYFVDTYNYYKIGDNAVYAVDYIKGFTYGSCSQIISFYRNNLHLFGPDFVQYMSDFISLNSNVIYKNNYSLCTVNNNSLVFLSYIKQKNKSKASLISPHHELIITSDMIKNLANITGTNKSFIVKNKLNSIEKQLFLAMLKKPPVYNLWTYKIINGFVNGNIFLSKLSFKPDYSIDMFANHKDWKEATLPKEVRKKRINKYQVFYFYIQTIVMQGKHYEMIIAQNYLNNQKLFKIYEDKIDYNNFYDFTSGLIKDVNNKICFIIDTDNKKNNGFLFDDKFGKYINSNNLKIIIPPDYQSVFNSYIIYV